MTAEGKMLQGGQSLPQGTKWWQPLQLQVRRVVRANAEGSHGTWKRAAPIQGIALQHLQACITAKVNPLMAWFKG